MRELRTNTATRVSVGPFTSPTDGVTPVTSLTVTSCKLTLIVDDGGVPTLVLDAMATASGGNNDLVHITGDDAGMFDLELTAANLNYLGRAILNITDPVQHCPVFHEFMIKPAMVYDSTNLGTDRFDVNVTHIADASQSAGINVSQYVQVISDEQLPGSLVGGRIDASVGAMADGVIGPLTLGPDTGLRPVRYAGVQSGSTTTSVILDAGASAVNDAYKHLVLRIVSGNGIGEERPITGYNGTSKAAAVFPAFTATPDNGSGYAIVRCAVNNWNTSWDAEVESECDDALQAKGYTTTVAGRIDAAITTRASQTSVDTLDDYVDTEVAALTTNVGTLLTRLGTPSDLGGGASVAANLSDIESQTDDIGVAGAGLTALAQASVWTPTVAGRIDVAVSTRASQTSLDTLDDYVDSEVATIVTQTTAASIRAAVGLASANLDSQFSGVNTKLDTIDDIIDTEVASIKVDTGTTLPALIAAIMSTAMTEVYSTDGGLLTPAMALYEASAHLGEHVWVGTDKRLRRRNGSTVAAHFTIDAEDTPLDITRS